MREPVFFLRRELPDPQPGDEEEDHDPEDDVVWDEDDFPSTSNFGTYWATIGSADEVQVYGRFGVKGNNFARLRPDDTVYRENELDMTV